MNINTILVVEDNLSLKDMIRDSLIEAGYYVSAVTTGEDALKFLRAESISLILLDINLDGRIRGDEVLSFIRKRHLDIPVFMVTGEMQLNYKIDCFKNGCDDYITKPFPMPELIARIDRHFKKKKQLNTDQYLGEIVRGHLVLDIDNMMISVNGKKTQLRKKIFHLLSIFLNNPHHIFSKQQIMSRVWPEITEADLNANTLFVHIRELRKIIEKNPSSPQMLKTVKGMGYYFSLPDV